MRFLCCLVYDAYAAFIGAADALGVSSERLAHRALTAEGLLRTGGEFLVAEADVDGAGGNVDDDNVAVLDLADVAAGSGFGADVADAEAGGAA